MNLHRTSGKPDWADTPPDKQNGFQQIAAATRGLGTPGNALTVVGFGLSIFGLAEIIDHYYLSGAIIIAIGRLCDILDGWIADKTGTKSPLGELLDAGIDKLITILTVIVFYVAGVAPAWALAALALPQVIITFISLRAIQQGGRVHPSRIGKLSMATGWIGLVGFLVMAAFQEPALITLAVYAATITSAVLGLTAMVGYGFDRKATKP